MLAEDPASTYVSEPLNVLHRRGVFSAPVEKWYTYINSENEAHFLPAFRVMLAFNYGLGRELRSLRSFRDALRMLRDLGVFLDGRLNRRRPVIKDPFAAFSAAWFADKLGCDVVITVRHPAGFASSLKRLGWTFPMNDLLSQPRLVRDHLAPDREAMERLAPDDVLGQAALLWRAIYRAVGKMAESNPRFIIVRQEDLALDPVPRFSNLYAALDLTFSPKVERAVLRSSSVGNPEEPSRRRVHSVRLDSAASTRTWRKRLDQAEIDRVRRLTEDVSSRFYSGAEWS